MGGQVSELDQGVALVTQGHADQAIPLLLRATSAKPEDAVAWKALGVGYASMGQYDLAEPAFGQACRLASKLADACYFQARALYALNRFEASLATMRKAGTGARVRLGEGQALEALGRFEDAEKALREAAALARADDPGPAVALGLMLLRSGRPHEAEASLAKTVLAHQVRQTRISAWRALCWSARQSIWRSRIWSVPSL